MRNGPICFLRSKSTSLIAIVLLVDLLDAVRESVIRLIAHFRAVLRLRQTLQYFVVARPGRLEAHFGGAVTL